MLPVEPAVLTGNASSPLINSHPRILFVRTDRLGDVLLNLPAVAALRAACPAAHVTMMVHPNLGALLEGSPEVDELMAYQDDSRRPWWWAAAGLACRLRAKRFDVAILSTSKKEFHVAAFLAGIPQRVGYDRKWGWLLTHRLPDAKALGERHEVEYNLDLIKPLGRPSSVPSWRWPQLEHEQLDVARLLEQHGIRAVEPFIVLHPWTSNPRKQWPLPRYQDVARRIAEELRHPVIVIGGPEEQPRVGEVRPDTDAVVNLVGQLTLKQLAALLRRAKLLVSNDSGPVHLAASVGTRTVVLFGTADPGDGPRRWGPWGSGHTVICKPCVEDITVDDVLAAVRRSLP